MFEVRRAGGQGMWGSKDRQEGTSGQDGGLHTMVKMWWRMSWWGTLWMEICTKIGLCLSDPPPWHRARLQWKRQSLGITLSICLPLFSSTFLSHTPTHPPLAFFYVTTSLLYSCSLPITLLIASSFCLSCWWQHVWWTWPCLRYYKNRWQRCVSESDE